LKREKNNKQYRDIAKLLMKYGFAHRQSGKGTSHNIFSQPQLAQNVVLVSHGKNDFLKAYQVNDAIKAL